jgi:hypothetical protein
MHLLQIDGDDAAVVHEVEDAGEEERRPAAVGAAFDKQFGPQFTKCFLGGPEVEDVLPDRLAQPGDIVEIVGLADEVGKKCLILPLAYATDYGLPIKVSAGSGDKGAE